ncbi:MAG: hypothetical protein V3574_01070 [Candidatus Moraniibacteriota bacterium]
MKKILKSILTLGIFFAVQFGTAEKAVAMDTFQLGQKILPVCLAYFNSAGALLDVWSNVTQADDSYVLKFFDEHSRELPLREILLRQYAEKSKKDVVERDKTEYSRFSVRGEYLEEVLTVV